MTFHVPTMFKTAFAAGVASVALALSVGVKISSFADIAHLFYVVLFAFIVGAVHAMYPSFPVAGV